jgi:hypothetical protein
MTMLSEHINKIEEEDSTFKHDMDDVDNISFNCMTSDGDTRSPLNRNESDKAIDNPLLEQEKYSGPQNNFSSFRLNKVQMQPPRAEPEEFKVETTPTGAQNKEEVPSSSEKKKFKVRFDEAY